MRESAHSVLALNVEADKVEDDVGCNTSGIVGMRSVRVRVVQSFLRSLASRQQQSLSDRTNVPDHDLYVSNF